MKTSLRYWMDARQEEKSYFRLTHPTWFTTALVDTLGVTKGPTSIDYWLDNINKRRQSSLWAQRDTYAAIRNFTGPDYQQGKLPSGNDGRPIRTTVAYQMTDYPPNRYFLPHKLEYYLRQIGASNIRIHKMKTWRYFPRYSADDLANGVLWRILEMQGKHGMWYIGSSVCFESIKSVLEYNELLLRNFNVPKN